MTAKIGESTAALALVKALAGELQKAGALHAAAIAAVRAAALDHLKGLSGDGAKVAGEIIALEFP